MSTFPHQSLVSLLTLVDGHLALEVGMIGREGMVGLPLVLGHTVSLGARAGAGIGHGHAHGRGALPQGISPEPAACSASCTATSIALMAQISQTAACNRFHVVETRLARWLLMTHDRVKSDEFRMTHEFLAHMLGVRRVGVTKAAHALQQRKLISYSRGDITVLDRRGTRSGGLRMLRGGQGHAREGVHPCAK